MVFKMQPINIVEEAKTWFISQATQEENDGEHHIQIGPYTLAYIGHYDNMFSHDVQAHQFSASWVNDRKFVTAWDGDYTVALNTVIDTLNLWENKYKD